MNTVVQNSMIVFYILAVPAFIGDIFANVNGVAHRVGRIATGLMMLVGGAGVNASFLISGSNYSGFADDAKFSWVTQAWNAVVPENYAFFIGLLITFEAIVGILILSGGWPTRIGILCAIAFHVALGLFFSTFLTVYAVVMIVALALLLRAEWRPEGATQARPLRHGLA